MHLLTKEQRDDLIGENYKLLIGFDEYLEKLPAEKREKFVNDIQKIPTVYHKLFEAMFVSEDGPGQTQNVGMLSYRGGVEFLAPSNLPRISSMLAHGNYDAADVASVMLEHDGVDFVRVRDPEEIRRDFGDKLLSSIRVSEEDVAAVQRNEAPAIDAAGLQDIDDRREQEALAQAVKARREEKRAAEERKRYESYRRITRDPESGRKAERKGIERERARERKQADAGYKAYMTALKRTDPAEHKRMTALHKEYKKENTALDKISQKLASMEDTMFLYETKANNYTITAKERKKWEQLRTQYEKMGQDRDRLVETYQAKSAERVEKGMISPRHAAIRDAQLQAGDTIRLPFRSVEQTRDAGQLAPWDRYDNPRYSEEYLETLSVRDNVIRSENDARQTAVSAQNEPEEEYLGLGESRKPTQAEKKRIEAEYKRYMSALSKTDPAEYKVMTALHKLYKKENAALEKFAKQIEACEQEIQKYEEKESKGTLTAKEYGKWQALAQKQYNLEIMKTALCEKYVSQSNARAEGGFVSARHARIRIDQLRGNDTVRLPLRTLEQTKDAGQLKFRLDENGDRTYQDETYLDYSPLDNVTRRDPTVSEEDRQLDREYWDVELEHQGNFAGETSIYRNRFFYESASKEEASFIGMMERDERAAIQRAREEREESDDIEIV